MVCFPSSMVAGSGRLPQWPVDRTRPAVSLPSRRLRVAVCGELIHEPIRRGIIRLADAPHGCGDGGKQHEEIEFNVLAGQVQVQRARDLRLQHTFEFSGRLLHDEVVGEHSRTMQDAIDFPMLASNVRDEPVNLIAVAEVELLVIHSSGASAQAL